MLHQIRKHIFYSSQFALIVLVIFCLLPNFSLAQSENYNNDEPDTEAIAKMKEYLTTKLSLSSDVRGFINQTCPTKRYDIEPNSKNVLRAALNYRWLSLTAATTAKFLPGNNNDALKGKTKSTSYSLNFSFSHLQQNISYNRIKGFYLANTSIFQPGSYKLFPNLVYSGFEGKTAYKFNKDFSLSALNTQTERQLKSEGTFMPSVSYRYYIIDDQTPLTEQNSSQKSNNLEVIFSAGYLYTLVIDQKWYASAGVAPGLGFIHTKSFTRTIHSTDISASLAPLVHLELPLSVGYNSYRFFTGFQFDVAVGAYSHFHTTDVIVNNHSTYQLFMGYRFDAPETLKRITHFAEDHRPKLL